MAVTLALALAFLASDPSSASVVSALTLDQLVAEADVIALGTVESRVSRWLDGRIVTDSVVHLQQALAGVVSDGRLTVRTLGGEVGAIGQIVFGEPRLERGETYLLFLDAVEDDFGEADVFRPAGMAQGALPVRESDGGAVVGPNGQLSNLYLPSVETTPWLTEPRALAEVIEDIRTAIREAGR